MINGSVTRCTEVMSEKETLEAFIDGAKKAASTAREFARIHTNKDWEDRAEMLDAIRINGVKLAQMKAMSRLETLMAANIKQGKAIQ